MGKDLARGAGEGQEAEQGEAQNKGGDKSSQHVILRPGCRQAGGGGNVVPREGMCKNVYSNIIHNIE